MSQGGDAQGGLGTRVRAGARPPAFPRPGPTAVLLVVGALAALCLAALLVAIPALTQGRRTTVTAGAGSREPVPALRLRSRGGAAALVCVAALAAVLALGRPATVGPRLTPSRIGASTGVTPAHVAPVPAADTPGAQLLYSQFVQIESAVAIGERAVAAEDARILALARPPSAAAATPAGSPRAVATASPTTSLAALLSSHQRTVSGYQATLQTEYRFFVAAAQQPAVGAALTQATAAVPAASAVVQYDLGVTSAELRQEHAIAAARQAAAAQPVHPAHSAGGVPTFSAPVGGVVTQGFGPSPLPLEPAITYDGTAYGHFHTGIDIANVLDTPVGASAPGRVILAGSDHDPAGRLVGYGNYVVVDHGHGYITLYAHLDQVLVTLGQVLVRGEEIGLLGSTGWSTGPHLHFEIRHDGQLLNPETLLGAAVRP